PARKSYRILFICTGNACRSPIAEGLARHYGMGPVDVSSAGVSPSPLNPFAARSMAEINVDISKHVARGVEERELDGMDLVVTLCDYAQSVCPAWPPS